MIGAISALIAVILGAFGAHGLEDVLTARMLEVFETGNRYHFYHSFALLFVGLLAFHIDGKWLRASGWCFLFGVLIFSGSLYALALSGMGMLGAITPVGGLLYMIGWLLLAVAAYTRTKK